MTTPRSTTTTTATMPTAEDPSLNFSLQFIAEHSILDNLLLVHVIRLYTKQVVDARDCAQAIQEDQELARALKQARIDGNYGRIVDLSAETLTKESKKPQEGPVAIAETNTRDDEARAALEAWRLKFEGINHELLVECLRFMNKNRTNLNGTKKRYLNFTSIVQSSGMGKSRTVDEASKLIFTLPFTLRDEKENAYYPFPDTAVRENFLEKGGDGSYVEARVRYLKFMGHLFSAVATEVRAMATFADLKGLACAWRNLVYDAQQPVRKRVYDFAIQQASTDHISSEKDAIAHAQEHLRVLSNTIDSKCANPPGQGDLRILIYFDEAHCLTESTVVHKGIGVLNPNGELRTTSVALRSALGDLKDFELMCLFLSTSFSLDKYEAPKAASWSAQGIGYVVLQQPFVELPFRYPRKERIIEGGKDTNLDTFCSIRNLASLSRPLFKARFKTRPDDITQFAKMKLCDGSSDAYTKDSYTAVVTSRVMAEFPLPQMSTIDRIFRTEAKLVSAHLRVVYDIPKHREFMTTGYPSEPLLAEAAARVMFERPKETHEAFLECLEGELISRGERGAAIVRYLSILGFDKARNWDGDLEESHFSRPLPLLDFLRALFGNDNYEQIKMCRAHNVFNGGAPLEDAFKDAYVYFTHFARAKDASIISDACALVALSRGMAWQLYPGQADIDILIPLAFVKNTAEPLDRTKVQYMALQIKNRRNPKAVDVSPDTWKISSGTTNDRPCIIVVLELGAKADTERRIKLKLPYSRGCSSKPTEDDPPCYFFTVYGCDSKAFGVIRENPEGKPVYDALLSKDDLINDHPREGNFQKALRAMKPLWSDDLCKVQEAMDVDSQ